LEKWPIHMLTGVDRIIAEIELKFVVRGNHVERL
jgi:hypothetical protein